MQVLLACIARKSACGGNSTGKLKRKAALYRIKASCTLTLIVKACGSGELSRYLIMGELGLDGNLMPIKGALPIAIKAPRREQSLTLLTIRTIRCALPLVACLSEFAR